MKFSLIKSRIFPAVKNIFVDHPILSAWLIVFIIYAVISSYIYRINGNHGLILLAAGLFLIDSILVYASYRVYRQMATILIVFTYLFAIFYGGAGYLSTIVIR